MRIFKNALVAAFLGHLAGIVTCLAATAFAVKVPDWELASSLAAFSSVAISTLVMALINKRLGGKSIINALASGVSYLALGILLGVFTGEGSGMGLEDALCSLGAILVPLALCFSGVRIHSGKRVKRLMRSR